MLRACWRGAPPHPTPCTISYRLPWTGPTKNSAPELPDLRGALRHTNRRPWAILSPDSPNIARVWRGAHVFAPGVVHRGGSLWGGALSGSGHHPFAQGWRTFFGVVPLVRVSAGVHHPFAQRWCTFQKPATVYLHYPSAPLKLRPPEPLGQEHFQMAPCEWAKCTSSWAGAVLCDALRHTEQRGSACSDG